MALYHLYADDAGDTYVRPIPLQEVDMSGSGATLWMPDGRILLTGADSVGLSYINVRGGDVQTVIPIDKQTEIDFHELGALPNGGVLFAVATAAPGFLIDEDRVRELIDVYERIAGTGEARAVATVIGCTLIGLIVLALRHLLPHIPRVTSSAAVDA